MDNAQRKPAISVVMPFYNCEKFIKQSLESVLNQTFRDFELILINDASTDNSDEIVRECIKNDPRVRYIKNETNRKITHNLNHGLDLARADIIARMDGDDICELERFEKQYNFLRDNPSISVVGSYITIIDENDTVYDHRTKPTDSEEIKKRILYYSPLVHPTVMFRKADILSVGKYRNYLESKFPFPEDLDLWCRLVYNGYKISNIPEYMVRYRRHKNNCDQNPKMRAIADLTFRKKIIKEYHLVVSLRVWCMIYLQYFVGYYFSATWRERIEGYYKMLFLNEK